ncbi:hypothetical protein GCM10007897_25450 [Sphingobium jiangsuense]|uniref:Uncharacterized protein n=1 Tax=Sphingobium jiangsuense TaxID=870476 RepID=A0A7W6BNE5_9SPHN|nr:hypothetical protein [Sphingobium jiangsuense]MBB3928337.1 hypothetical protein [Sphingobium jiangsuense]GLT01154.1 hypothetical protein GCM10007897_25450 [Sphingobium jiangsuense]
MSERLRFRLVQGGIPVAWSEGPRAYDEIMHYAVVYSQDGPVKIQAHERGKWRPWPPRLRKEPTQ